MNLNDYLVLLLGFDLVLQLYDDFLPHFMIITKLRLYFFNGQIWILAASTRKQSQDGCDQTRFMPYCVTINISPSMSSQ